MHAIAENLNFPTSVTLGEAGAIYVAESGLPFGGAPAGGSVVRIAPDGSRVLLLSGLREPVNGLIWDRGSLFISEGGHAGRISRLDLVSAEHVTILDGLPGFGNYRTNMAAIGPDGKLYFSQGAMTNTGVIGIDSQELAWLSEIEHHCDIPGYDIQVGGFVSQTQTSRTGAFAPYGSTLPHGTRIAGRVPCTASVMRCDLDGENLELVAWGVRNAYGLCFLSDGRLIATDQGADARGVRPVGNCPDFLYEVRPGAWYGFPDFFGGVPVTDACYLNTDGGTSEFVLLNHHELPPPEKPLATFGVNVCALKLAQVPSHFPFFPGDLIVAQFGDERPVAAPHGPPVGRNLVRIATADWSVHPLPELQLRRPIDIAFHPSAPLAYVVDFGEFEYTFDKHLAARAGTGALWQLDADDLGMGWSHKM